MDLIRSLGCAGSAAVITVTFVHPIDTVGPSRSAINSNLMMLLISQFITPNFLPHLFQLKTRLQVSGTKGARDYRAVSKCRLGATREKASFSSNPRAPQTASLKLLLLLKILPLM